MDYRLEEVRLSDRERTVLLLAADGLTDKEIAQSLGLSLKTIHTYWDRMRQKFSANTRTQVFAKFLRINVDAASDGSGLKNLFATWEEGVWIIGTTGRTIYANQRIANTFGYTLQEFPEYTFGEVMESVGAADLVGDVLNLRAEGRTCEAVIRINGGQHVWLNLKCAPIHDEKGQPHAIAVLVRDVTIEKRVRHALDSCEAVLESLTDLSSDQIAKFDHELHCVYVNPALVSVLNVPPQTIVGQHVTSLRDVFSPNKIWADALERALSTGQAQHFVVPANGQPHDHRTWLLPEPSAEFHPKSILAITRSSA